MSLSFTKHYQIKKGVAIGFANIPIDENEIEAFICPFLIEKYKYQPLILEISERMKNFLRELNNSYIKKNDKINGVKFLDHLHEPNEYHLGYSIGNKGKAVSAFIANDIFSSLRNNAFAKQGFSVTNEAHNVLLLVHGIGQDIMSDIIANVCRDIFAKFTLDECKRLKVPVQTVNIEFYNDKLKIWETAKVDLPVFGRKIILVPSQILAGTRAFVNRYNWFVSSNYISKEVMTMDNPPKKMVTQMKDGTKKAIIKEIYKQYKKPKKELVNFVVKYANSLDEFIEYAKINYPELDLDHLR